MKPEYSWPAIDDEKPLCVQGERGGKQHCAAHKAAIFAKNQRALFQDGELSKDRQELLLQIAGWTWTAASADTKQLADAVRRRPAASNSSKSAQPVQRPKKRPASCFHAKR